MLMGFPALVLLALEKIIEVIYQENKDAVSFQSKSNILYKEDFSEMK